MKDEKAQKRQAVIDAQALKSTFEQREFDQDLMIRVCDRMDAKNFIYAVEGCILYRKDLTPEMIRNLAIQLGECAKTRREGNGTWRME